MAALDVDIFRSKQFVFVVGENQAAFSVHAAVIAKQSRALNVLINGSMEEASKGKAIFEDVEEDTFIRFCQFAYTGDYTTPHVPTVGLLGISSPVAISYDTSTTNNDERGSIEPEGLSKKGGNPENLSKGSLFRPLPQILSKGSLLRQSLQDQLYITGTTRIMLAARCEVRQNSNCTEDYTTIFLGHAQLYVFAEKWGIVSLKTLALSKLHKTLTTFTLYSTRRRDIVELLRYTFSNDHTPDLVGAVDDLRSLVMLYTACEVENLIQCPEFLSLIGEGGQLAQNLVQMLMKRIS